MSVFYHLDGSVQKRDWQAVASAPPLASQSADSSHHASCCSRTTRLAFKFFGTLSLSDLLPLLHLSATPFTPPLARRATRPPSGPRRRLGLLSPRSRCPPTPPRTRWRRWARDPRGARGSPAALLLPVLDTLRASVAPTNNVALVAALATQLADVGRRARPEARPPALLGGGGGRCGRLERPSRVRSVRRFVLVEGARVVRAAARAVPRPRSALGRVSRSSPPGTAKTATRFIIKHAGVRAVDSPWAIPTTRPT